MKFRFDLRVVKCERTKFDFFPEAFLSFFFFFAWFQFLPNIDFCMGILLGFFTSEREMLAPNKGGLKQSKHATVAAAHNRKPKARKKPEWDVSS